jgi:hypothetical protein
MSEKFAFQISVIKKQKLVVHLKGPPGSRKHSWAISQLRFLDLLMIGHNLGHRLQVRSNRKDSSFEMLSFLSMTTKLGLLNLRK